MSPIPDYSDRYCNDLGEDDPAYPEPGIPLAASKDFGIEERARGPRIGEEGYSRRNVTGIEGRDDPVDPDLTQI